MKHKRLKNYLKFGLLLFGINLSLISCQQEHISEESNVNGSPFSMRIISKNEFNKNPKVSEQLKLFTNKSSNSNILNKGIYNSDYDFTVNTDYSKYIESDDGSLHSYTFLIEREEDNGLLENLVLTLQSDGTYKAQVVIYDFSNDGQAEINTAPLENFDTSQYLGRFSFSYSCTQTVTYSTSFNDDCSCQFVQILDVQTNCTYTYYNEPEFIDTGDSSSGGGWNNIIWTGGGGGGGSSTYTGNNNDNTGTTIATSPFTQSQVDKLTIQTKNSKIKTRIQQMVRGLNTATKEQGSEFRRNSGVIPIGDLYSEYQIPASQTTFSGTRFPNALANSLVRVHTHHNTANSDGGKLAPVFSIEDVFGMSEFYKQVKDANSSILSRNEIDNISSILVSRRGLYALRVTDADKVIEFNEFLTNGATNNQGKTYQEVLLDLFHQNVIQKTINQCGNCSDAQQDALFELNFINYFKQIDSGLSLFVSYETDDNEDYIWTFLTN